MPIPPEDLRVGVVSDASWGSSREETVMEDNSEDFWEETPEKWIRHHCEPRHVLFHSGAAIDYMIFCRSGSPSLTLERT